MAREKTREEIALDLWGVYETALNRVKSEGIIITSSTGAKAHPAWSVFKDTISMLDRLGAVMSVDDLVPNGLDID